MATQNSNSSKEEKGITRRNFLRAGIWTTLAVLAVETVGATIASMWPKAQSSAAGAKVRVGKATGFPIGSVTFFPEGKFFLAHVDSGFLAMSHVCTHLGCIVPWVADEKSEDKLAEKGRFNCPCHGGIYDRYGLVKAGPPLRPLDLYPITLNGDQLVVDTGILIRRQVYEESQAVKV
ncbi:MAG: ubiquinol-cytochrome c reductase iron-sulfur subunit [Chloroflexi bacterium]|nr:ubiquinol-cytochrome c reductase iron-sulfur subunit [Chloroflexota bacterium]